MRNRKVRIEIVFILTFFVTVPALIAQNPNNSRFGNGMRMPLSPVPLTGEPIAPFLEGWYANEDGTYTMSFGFFNLNSGQVLDIPIGPDNFIEPA